MSVLPIFLAFISGAVGEGLAVLWVHFAERNQRRWLFVISCAQGAATVLGIGEAIQDWRAGVAFVLGYGVGPQIALYFKPEKPPA